MILSKRFGPGFIVAAAFIGPGTVTTATRSGASFGFALLWVVLFSVLATIVLQEMAARVGVVTRGGLGDAVRRSIDHRALRAISVALILAAVGVGNMAYQAGNLTGACLGLQVLSGLGPPLWAVALGLAAGALLWTGAYRLIERLLIVLVGLMSLVFVATAVMVRPDVTAIVKGLLIPRLPDGSLTTVIALIGTTVVPYNLFLHASAARRKWDDSVPVDTALSASRADTLLSVSVGGAVTLAIVATSAAFFASGARFENAADMAGQLEPLLGAWAQRSFAVGLIAAGLTSAITAPLAAAYATSEVLGWKGGMRSARFRAVWLTVIVVGTLFAALGRQPIKLIVFAQAANGLILPLIALFLLYAVNRKRLLGRHVNGLAANVLGGGVVLVAAGLGAWKLLAG
ncbi:MAG: Nramp family divalent metal transporter [Phycisphaerae bacterium]